MCTYSSRKKKNGEMQSIHPFIQPTKPANGWNGTHGCKRRHVFSTRHQHTRSPRVGGGGKDDGRRKNMCGQVSRVSLEACFVLALRNDKERSEERGVKMPKTWLGKMAILPLGPVPNPIPLGFPLSNPIAAGKKQTACMQVGSRYGSGHQSVLSTRQHCLLWFWDGV